MKETRKKVSIHLFSNYYNFKQKCCSSILMSEPLLRILKQPKDEKHGGLGLSLRARVLG